jgi:hypothetical protein
MVGGLGKGAKQNYMQKSSLLHEGFLISAGRFPNRPSSEVEASVNPLLQPIGSSGLTAKTRPSNETHERRAN